MRRVYLDANATEPLRPEAEVALLSALSCVGNPASVHAAGRDARRILESARDTLAKRFGARPEGAVFTSGGTEANAMAVHGLGEGRALMIGATEHDAVRAAAPHAAVLPVDRAGQADLNALDAWLAQNRGALVCLMLANNETGTIQPVAQAVELCRRHGALIHVDAVQAAGRMEVSLSALGATSLAISSHKLGGPPGVGALLLAREAEAIAPLIKGGGQERGRRGGTPAVAMIAGFAAAAKVARPAPGLGGLRERVEDIARRAGAVICGGGKRLINTSCLALAGRRADAQVMAMDLAGVAISAGAACSSGRVGTSHVLDAMGLGSLAGEAIRVSLPWNVQPEDIDHFASAYLEMAGRFTTCRA